MKTSSAACACWYRSCRTARCAISRSANPPATRSSTRPPSRACAWPHPSHPSLQKCARTSMCSKSSAPGNSTRSKPSPAAADNKSPVPCAQPAARPILADMNSDSLKDQFLIAMPQLDDPNFEHSLTYILEHNEHGAMGLTLNRPVDIRYEDVLEDLGIEPNAPIGPGHQVVAGGPVE